MPEECEGIRFLSVDDLIIINARLIAMKTPGEQTGVRDMGALERAQQSPNLYRWFQGTEDIITLGSVLFESIARNHAFQNANKRTAFVGTSIFLLLNGHELTAPEEDAVLVSEAIVKHEIDREYLERFLYHWRHPVDNLSVKGNDALRRLVDRMMTPILPRPE